MQLYNLFGTDLDKMRPEFLKDIAEEYKLPTRKGYKSMLKILQEFADQNQAEGVAKGRAESSKEIQTLKEENTRLLNELNDLKAQIKN